MDAASEQIPAGSMGSNIRALGTPAKEGAARSRRVGGRLAVGGNTDTRANKRHRGDETLRGISLRQQQTPRSSQAVAIFIALANQRQKKPFEKVK